MRYYRKWMNGFQFKIQNYNTKYFIQTLGNRFILPKDVDNFMPLPLTPIIFHDNVKIKKINQYEYEVDDIVVLDNITPEKLLLYCGCLLKYIPLRKITMEMVSLSMNSGCPLRYVPVKFRTISICRKAVMNNGLDLNFVPLKLHTKEIIGIAVDSSKGQALNFVSPAKRDYKLCTKGLLFGISLVQVPPELLDRDMCSIAVMNNPHNLPLVPDRFMTRGMCNDVVHKHPELADIVPGRFRVKKYQNTDNDWIIWARWKKLII